MTDCRMCCNDATAQADCIQLCRAAPQEHLVSDFRLSERAGGAKKHGGM